MMRRLFLTSGSVILVGLALMATAPRQGASPDKSTEAARLNNLGAAYMNQQLFEKGVQAFQDAAALDPKLEIAKLNQGIALLNLTRIEPAKQVLEEAVKRDPNDPHAWFNLGLLYKNSDNPQGAIDAFRHVTEIDPNDADSWYFLGAAYAQMKQYPQAIDAFQHALKVNQLHASAEFGLARVYQQSGDAARARENLQKFQHITQAKLGSPIGLAYGDQGKYSLVEESPAVTQRVLPQIPVKFVDVTKEAGIVAWSGAELGGSVAKFFAPGACFLDYDGDGRIDLFLPDSDLQGAMSLYHNVGNGKFEDVTKKGGLDRYPPGISCTSGDYDNDGFPDLAIALQDGILLLHNEKNGTFKDVTHQAGITFEKQVSQVGKMVTGSAEPVGLTLVDYDHDGDLDLYVTEIIRGIAPSVSLNLSPGRAVMWRNNGNGTFTDVTDATALSGWGFSASAIGTDFNNDRAVDLVTTGVDSRGGGVGGVLFHSTVLFKNPREGKFLQYSPISSPQLTTGVAVLDFDHDGWMDLAFTLDGSPGITLWRNNHGTSFEQVKLPETNWVRAVGIAAFDHDNDGWVDLVAVGETKDHKGEVRLFRNLGPDGFKDVTADVGLDKIQLKDPRAIITGDFDNDGATDLLITQNHGPAVLLKNEGGNRNNWLRLALKGLNDNKSAIGTKVEVFSDGIRQKFEIYGSNGYLGQNSPYLTVGLGRAKQADVVRMLWPTGVLQDEVEVPADQEKKYTEIDRRGSSCPTLFVWNGKHYQLVADILGAGVIGHWVGPGERNIPRPTEWVKIDRDLIQEKFGSEDSHFSQNRREVGHSISPESQSLGAPRLPAFGRRGNGTLSFRLMEPMEEVVYLDQVRLLAVDHPTNEEVYPNEYFASNPPYPEFKVVASRNP